MPKKPKINKRLDKLFSEIKTVEPPATNVDALPKGAASSPDLAARAASPASSSTRPHFLQPQITLRNAREGTPAAIALAFQMSKNEWATLQVIDDSHSRSWSDEDRLLVEQVTDQLSLALENARLFQETQARAEEMALLNRIVSAAASSLDLTQTLNIIASEITHALQIADVTIGLLTEDRKFLKLMIELHPVEPDLTNVGTLVPFDLPMFQEIERTRQPVVIENVAERNLHPAVRKVVEYHHTQTLVVFPITVGETIIGTAGLHITQPGRRLTENEMRLTQTILTQASIAIQNARLFQETQARAEEMAALNRIVTAASQTLEIHQLLDNLLHQILEVIGFESGLISLYDEDSHTLNLAAYHNLPAAMLHHIEIHGLKNSLCEYVFLNNQPLGLNDLRESAPLDVSPLIAEGILSYLGVPLEVKGRVVGTLCTFSRIPGKINERLLQLTRSVGIQIGFAIENARLFEATQRSQAELSALFAAMTDVIIVYDKEGRYKRIAPTNPSRLFRPPEEMLGKTITEVLPADVAQILMNAIQDCLRSGQTVQVEYPLVIEGNQYWFDGTISRLSEEEVFLVARDITARKQAEMTIQRRNEYLAATAEIGRLVTSTLDLNTIFKRAVDLIRNRFGFYHVGLFIVEETGFNAVLQEATGDAGAEMKRQKHSLPVGSKSIVGEVTASGNPFVVNDTTTSPIHRPNPLLPKTRAEAAIPLRVGSRIIGALDIQSEHPNAFTEDEIAVLQTLADQIAIAIDNARSYELSIQAVKEMREVDRLKSQFLANMSHELRTPLNSIIGFSRVILKGIDGPITELQQNDLTAIYNSGQHLLALINDILDLSKIEAGKMELAFDEVNIVEMINSVMSTATGLVKDKPIILKKNIAPNLPTARADAIRVRQVLLNLLSNAAKFTEEGEIRVEASVEPGPNGQPEILISVSDTGPGIAEADQAKLFQPFSQVDDSPTRKTGGSGLGLSISRRLIEMHGGRIGVHSTVGQGSTFYFTLPIYQAALPEKKEKTILAIDDDPQVISLYERYLRPQGYEIIPLTDPAQAVPRAAEIQPFAITLDIMMPGIDGWQVLQSLKAEASTRHIPVIICSILEEQERGFSLGAADYLVKPILEDDLVQSLDRLNGDDSIHEVLVIDDDDNDLRLLGKMLTDQGRYKPILAQGGVKGWEMITSKTPQAVILDLFMPEMDGFTIMEKMRSSPALREVPVIVVSGADLTAEQKQRLNEFGQQMLTKGALKEKDLISTLEHALKRVRPK